MKNIKRTLLLSTVIFAGLPIITAQAFETPVPNPVTVKNTQADAIAGTSYAPAYFLQYAPRTAADMLSRIPGYDFQGSRGPGGGGKRGLGQGGANVLINGGRISGKTSAREQLGRIPASNVIEIIILDGASSDIPGLTGQVANLIIETKGVTGTWEWNPQFRKHRAPNLLDGAVSVSGEKGKLTYAASLKSDPFRGGSLTTKTITSADDVLYEIRNENSNAKGNSLIGALDLSWTPKNDHLANFNAKYEISDFKRNGVSHRRALAERGNTVQAISTRDNDGWEAEVSADYQRPVLFGKVKFIGFYSFDHSPSISTFDTYDTTGQVQGSRYLSETDRAEAILRTEYSWTNGDKHNWQFGIEGAFNSLDNTASLLGYNPDTGQYNPNPDLTNARTRVEEKRAETTLTYTRTLSPKLDVQASLGAEYSELSQSTLSRNFFRPKGFVTSTYKPSSTFSIRSKISRDVGQLNFSDFLSSVSLDDGEDSAGNANLVPEQAWAGQIEFDKDLGHGNRLKFRINGSKISDIVDRIPIGEDGDAVGNIDSAHKYAAHLTTSLKGDQWGLPGTQLDVVLGYHNSSVVDPLLSFKRDISGGETGHWSVRFRHDIENTDWAYGGNIGEFNTGLIYRLRTITERTKSKPNAGIFIEHKNVFGMKARLNIINALNALEENNQIYYTARRDIGVHDRTEFQSKFQGAYVKFNLSGTF